MQDPEAHLKKLGLELEGAVEPGSRAVLDPSHRVVVNGQLYWASSPGRTAELRASPYAYTGPLRDPVTGAVFSPKSSSPRRDVGDEILYFSSEESAGAFDRGESEAESGAGAGG